MPKNSKCLDCNKQLTNPYRPPKRCRSCDNLFRWSNPEYKKSVGKQISETKIKEGTHKGEKNPRWKGNKVSYGALHTWIKEHYGFPNTCECCGLVSDDHQIIQWANISRKYKRVRSDWIRLCAKCHKMFDKNNKQKVYVKRKRI